MRYDSYTHPQRMHCTLAQTALLTNAVCSIDVAAHVRPLPAANGNVNTERGEEDLHNERERARALTRRYNRENKREDAGKI